MFYLIGLGLKPKHLTIEAKEAIERCSKVFLETYTSAYSEGSVEELKKIIGKDVLPLDRKGVEEGFGPVLKEAKSSSEDIALLVFGNPLSATTHIQLLLDAKRFGIECRVVAGISVYNFLALSGLDQYRFGRTCTVVAPKANYAPESFFDVIEKNLGKRMHSLCLLDFDAESKMMMTVSEALQILEKIDKKRGKRLLEKATLIGLYGMGAGGQKVKVAGTRELQQSSFNLFPQALVVAAELNEKEREALEKLNE